MPKITTAKEPQTLSPLTRATWAYQDIDNLMNDGIYAPEDLARLHEHAMFPMERAAIIEHVARRLAGKDAPEGAVELRNLLDQASVKEMAKSALSDFWSGFTQFGIYSAGVIAIVVICQLIKSAIETIIRGYTLHQLYGWSRRLFGAVFSSVTHLFARNLPQLRERGEQVDVLPLEGDYRPGRPRDERAEEEDRRNANIEVIRRYMRKREAEGPQAAPRVIDRQ